jgi:hypothetical protein
VFADLDRSGGKGDAASLKSGRLATDGDGNPKATAPQRCAAGWRFYNDRLSAKRDLRSLNASYLLPALACQQQQPRGGRAGHLQVLNLFEFSAAAGSLRSWRMSGSMRRASIVAIDPELTLLT